MGTRELVILILGLAVVAVILRGLYIAMQARRGQLRLAIDKNIPRDVDLDALEMAELPNGGARVVAKNGESNPRGIAALKGTPALDLGGISARSGPVPVLMDSVALGKRQVSMPTASAEIDDEFDDEFEDDELDEDFDEEFDAEFEEDLEKDLEELVTDEDFDDDDLVEEDEDDEFDPYLDDEDEDEDEDEEQLDDFEDEDDEELVERPGGDDYFEDDDELNFNQGSGRIEPAMSPLGDAEEEFESIPMTAGERIGGQPPGVRSGPQFAPRSNGTQASLFGDEEHNAPAPKRAALLKPSTKSKSPADPSVTSTQPLAGKRIEPRAAPAKEIRAVGGSNRDQRELRPAEPSEVMVINVMSRDGELFHGDDLLQALITTGLKYGEMNIFHYRLKNSSGGGVVFSVANILKPGTFDLNEMGEFTTRGVSLFLAMPSAISNAEAFELMLKTAQQLRTALDGELKDDRRNPMTPQTIELYRQRVSDFELRRLRAAQA